MCAGNTCLFESPGMLSFPRRLVKKVPQLIVLPLVSALAACGGGSGGGSGDDGSSQSPAQPSAVQLSGVVNKGIVRNGLVSIYSVLNGQADDLLATTSTNSNGQFQVRLSGYEGPVYIEVTAVTSGTPTTMVCDVAVGCGSFAPGSSYDSNNNQVIDFGESFEVASDFRLTAALPSTTLSSQTSVTTLTHLATQFASQLPQGINDISIAVALSQVQNLFGIDANLLNLRAIDLTNPSAVSSATASELRYAIMASAIMGLTNDVAFNDTLQNLTTAFQINNGQLVQQDDDASATSLLDLVQQALATAQLLGLNNLTTELQQLQATLQNSETGSLTDAEASPTAGGESAAKIAAFLEDMRLWQGYLSLDPEQPSFNDMVDALGLSTGTDLTQMLQALAVAGQYGPIVALPDLALTAACDSLANYFARLTCRLLIAGKSLQEICEGSLNLVIFGRSLCDILNDLTLPLGAGVYGHFALYDGVVRIYGTLQDADVDITFTRNSRSSGRYGFSVAGTVDTAQGSMTINSGTVALVFEGGLDIKNLKLPEQASGSINVHYEQLVTAENPNGMSFDGDIALDLDLSNVRNTEGDEDGLIGLDQIQLTLTAEGDFSSAMGGSFAGALSINGGIDSNVVVQFETDLPDYSDRATVTLTASPEQIASGLVGTVRIAWAGKQYDVLNFTGDYNGIRVTNQDGVIMDLDLGVEDGAPAGYLMLNGTRFGTATPINGSLNLILADGSELIL